MESTRSEPTARKSHWCEVCGWEITPGEKYERVITFDAGSVGTWKAHLNPCSIAASLAYDADYYDYAVGSPTGEDVREWACEMDRIEGWCNAEAAEIHRRLEINEEQWRERRAAEIREGKQGD